MLTKHPESIELSQQNTLLQLIKQARLSDFGIEYGFDHIKSTDDFSKQVPLAHYDAHAAYWADFGINMRSTWPGSFQLLGKTSGTGPKGSKYIPITDAQIKSNKQSFIRYMRLLKKAGLFTYSDLLFKKIFFIGAQAENKSQFDYPIENMSVYGLQKAPAMFRSRIVPQPDAYSKFTFSEMIENLAVGAGNMNVFGAGGFPCWMLQFAEAVSALNQGKTLKALWPDLKFYMHSGMDIAPYLKPLKHIFGDIPFLETYVATEGFFGYQLPGEPGMRLNLNAGIYYEFMEINAVHSQEVRLENKPKAGKLYHLIISSNCGLWRYKTGDCIRFLDNTMQFFKFAGRADDNINIMGELIESQQIKNCIQWITDTIGIPLQFISILPYMNGLICCHIWFISYKGEDEICQTGLEQFMQQQNTTYHSYRNNNKGLMALKVLRCDSVVFYKYLEGRLV